MNKEGIDSVIKIALIHREHLNYALEKLANIFPVNAAKIQNLNDQEFLLLELLTGRFAKLQDFMGNKLIDLFLESVGEITTNLTMIDKINKLEKLRLIKDSDEWFVMRQLRNHLSHEYPDQPDLAAEYLNQTYNLSKQLIIFADSLVEEIKKHQ